MPSITRKGSRRYAVLACAAALFGATLSAPRPATARAQEDKPGCNPSYEYCEIYYTYYTNSSWTTVAGHAVKDCYDEYTLLDGYATIHRSYEAYPCPL
jgi:ABC-type sugar transport system substrate-binding protein